MDAQRDKRRLLAALEGQLERLARGRDARSCRRRVMVLLRSLQQAPRLPNDGEYPRRLAGNLSNTVGNGVARAAWLTLARADCLLWQRALARSKEPRDDDAVSRQDTAA